MKQVITSPGSKNFPEMTPTGMAHHVKSTTKSILSRAIGRECAGQVEFGRRWQNEVYDLGAVLIDAAKNVIAVGCVFRCDLVPALVYSRGLRHTFVLMENEYIERLDIRTMADVIVSLKICTNLRSSQWFGGQGEWHNSDRYELDEIAAPRGYYICSLFGSHTSQHCNQLGCRFDLLARSSRIDHIRVSLNEQQTKAEPVSIREAGISGKSFLYSHAGLQGIAITCDVRLRAISIITGEQYARYLKDREDALGPNEHLLELIADERIQRVDVCHSPSAVLGLRFVTTRRTTQWFGSAESGSLTSLVGPKSARSYVCGFFGTRDVDGICSLGAVYQVKPPPQDSSKHIARWDAMRDQHLPTLK